MDWVTQSKRKEKEENLMELHYQKEEEEDNSHLKRTKYVYSSFCLHRNTKEHLNKHKTIILIGLND